MAVALLARRPEHLQELTKKLRSQVPGSVFEAFPTDASKPDDIKKTFQAIKESQAFEGLKLDLAIFSVKHSSRKGFMEETYEVSLLIDRQGWGVGVLMRGLGIYG